MLLYRLRKLPVLLMMYYSLMEIPILETSRPAQCIVKFYKETCLLRSVDRYYIIFFGRPVGLS
jgi:hypothetical protein